MRIRALFIPLLLCTLGCHNWKTRTYDVTVKNDGPDPITVWLTKDGEPYEPGWYSPENLIMQSPKEPLKEISGVVIPAGKTASTGPRKGLFAERTNAILRVYAGKLGMNELLATKPGPSRVDVPLVPGVDRLVVSTSGALNVKRVE